MFSKLEELLKKKGATIADMCRATGINQSVFSNLKNRDSNLSFENLVKVAKYLDVPLEYFVKEED